MKKGSNKPLFSGKDFKRLFNINYILNNIITFGAYFILFGSISVLSYLSFIESFEFEVDWKVIGIFSIATIGLSWFCWSIFYRKQYEKVLGDDIEQQKMGKYSVHSRFYMAIKDWKDADLQMAIDNFNQEYTEKWLRWVEKTTGKPIKTIKEKVIDIETGEEEIVTTLGIEDLPYNKFKHKILMWRIKNHKYPQSGYNTSMELMSLFSFQEANMNKRNLRADKKFYRNNAISKLLISIFVITIGASLTPYMIQGELWVALFKLTLAIGALFSSVFMGAINGVRGARLKLSVVEDACSDLERWADKKPIIAPYDEPIIIEEVDIEDNIVEQNDILDKAESETKVTKDIFKRLNVPRE